jgi:hypothetical protein
MIKCIFTIDYEIYGNGEGSLKELVYEPAERLMTIFRKWGLRFVPFIEAAELEMIEAEGTDQAIDLVERQIRDLHRDGFELGLHLHPQWYNARYENGRWLLDYGEYNLCTLPRYRIIQIVDRSIAYFRHVLDAPDFTPLAFRAGNWLFQPTQPAAKVLAERGIRVDSSVFKGGLQHQHKLDYRQAVRNGYSWTFSEHVDIPDPKGTFLEVPVYTQMVPFWKMMTAKRIGMQRTGPTTARNANEKLHHLSDFLRFWYPLKLDYCRMTLSELTRVVDAVICEDREVPTLFRPLIAIGHTKDLVDFETVESFLSYLIKKEIGVSTFGEVHYRCLNRA